MLLNSPNARIWICASTGSNPGSMYTAEFAVLVGRESICLIIRFLNSSSCASGVAFGIINCIPY